MTVVFNVRTVVVSYAFPVRLIEILLNDVTLNTSVWGSTPASFHASKRSPLNLSSVYR